jgi:predicted nuclease of predicted toxin-antitoxin system
VKVLLERCMGRSTRVELERAGHDVVCTGDWCDDPGDAQILAAAYEEQRVLITIDEDFGMLAVVHGLPHAALIRLDKVPASQQAAACVRALDEHAGDLAAGAIITVERGRIRVRRHPLDNGDQAPGGDLP